MNKTISPGVHFPQRAMKFQKHPSGEMTALFHKRPYQGQSPEKAAIIFLSSDANYSPEISRHPFFEYILEYQKDGVAFWKKYGCHHPFLLSQYPFKRNQSGVPFHRNFNKLGLGPEYAGHISFLELLDVPTMGNKSEDKDQYLKLLSLSHLQYIENLILGGGHKLFFVSGGVLNDMAAIGKSHGIFTWLASPSGAGNQYSKSMKGNKIREICHFSSAKIHRQIEAIRSEIDGWKNATHFIG